jgi:hypothetical protein
LIYLNKIINKNYFSENLNGYNNGQSAGNQIIILDIYIYIFIRVGSSETTRETFN